MRENEIPEPPPSFAWDPPKYLLNLNQHQIRFDDAVPVFADPRGFDLEAQYREGGPRSVWLGAVYGVVLYTVYTDRDDGAITRMISRRRATKREVDVYYQGA